MSAPAPTLPRLRLWLGPVLLAGAGCCLWPGSLRAAGEARLGGVDCLSLAEVATRLGFKRRWVKTGQVLTLTGTTTRLTFELHRREMKIGDLTVHLGYPVAAAKGMLYVAASDYRHAIAPLFLPQQYRPVPNLRRVMIDPGHGGKDPGARGTGGVLEKTLTLDLGQRLGKLLQAAGLEVRMTRAKDVFLGLEARAAQANQAGADLFLSLHFNASSAKEVRGLETYAFTPAHQPSTARGTLQAADREEYPANRQNPWNVLAGFYVQRALVGRLGAHDRGLKRARFTVLRDLRCPGLLVEGGFLTNATEMKNLASTAYRQRMAEAIAEGVGVYRKSLTRLRGGS